MQVLVKLAEVGSMRRAAEAVNMTQPAISQLVAELEKLMETDLFFRHAKGVEPTEATQELLPIAYRVLSALEDGAENVANRLQQQDGVVRLVASPAALSGMIHGRLDAFASRHPGIQLHLSQIADGDLMSGVVEDSVDVICTREPQVVPEEWVFEKCVNDKLIVVCGNAHPLARSVSVSAEELGAAKWLLNRVGSVARKRFEAMAEAHDWPISCRVQIVMHIPEMTKEMLQTGKYLTIIPRSIAIPWMETGKVCALKTEATTDLRPLGFLWNKSRAGTATATLAAFLRNR